MSQIPNESATQARRRRRLKLKAQLLGARAARQSVPLSDNPYILNSEAWVYWRVAYAEQLAGGNQWRLNI